MGNALIILAITLAALAIIPYVLEVCLWFCRKPKLLVTIHSKEVELDSDTDKLDIRFWLGVKLIRGIPANVGDLQLILPLEAEPYQHPSTNEVFQQRAYVEGEGLRRALVMNAPSHPLSCTYSQVYMIAFRIPKCDNSIELDVISVLEIDEASLGFWAIFYRTRRYSETQSLRIQLD